MKNRVIMENRVKMVFTERVNKVTERIREIE